MNHPLSPASLSGAQVCFAVASHLLYVEPTAEDLALSVAADQFARAPFAVDDPIAAEGLAFMARWCAHARAAAAAEMGEASLARPCADDDEAAQARQARLLTESAAFIEAVGDVRREWLRLFAGVGAPEASCLESFYVEPNRHMFGECTLAVRAIYRRHGLQIEQVHREPDDHLGLMLGFVSHLIGEEEAARAAGDEAKAEALALEQDRFLADHVLPWLAVWRYGVARHATSDYFRGAGDFVFGLVACYVRRFAIIFDGEAQAFKRKR